MKKIAHLLFTFLLAISAVAQEVEEPTKDVKHGVSIEALTSAQFDKGMYALNYNRWVGKNIFSGGFKYAPHQYKGGYLNFYVYREKGLKNRVGLNVSYKRLIREPDKKLNMYFFYTMQFANYNLKYSDCSKSEPDTISTVLDFRCLEFTHGAYAKEWVIDNSFGFGMLIKLWKELYLNHSLGYNIALARRVEQYPQTYDPYFYIGGDIDSDSFHLNLSLSYYF